jgi:hypothetical protein
LALVLVSLVTLLSMEDWVDLCLGVLVSVSWGPVQYSNLVLRVCGIYWYLCFFLPSHVYGVDIQVQYMYIPPNRQGVKMHET